VHLEEINARFFIFQDQIVIQQGRLIDQGANKLGRTDVLAMIRHGAQYVFASKDADITEEDIEAVLAKGEAKVRFIISLSYWNHYSKELITKF
jgi:hypothetical protein